MNVLNLGAKAFLLQVDTIEKKKSTESNSAELDSIDENNSSDSPDCEDEENIVDAVVVEEDEKFDAVEDDQEDMIYTLEQLNSLNVERQLQTVGKARKLAVWINGAASRQNLIRQFCRGNNTNYKKLCWTIP